MNNEAWEQSHIPAPLVWSDDCLHCLCNLPHSMEAHTQSIEKASEERRGEIQEMERDTPSEGEVGDEGEQEEQLTPDELRNLLAYLFSLQEAIERQQADTDTPILDAYCWDPEHDGGWTCRQCFANQQKGENYA